MSAILMANYSRESTTKKKKVRRKPRSPAELSMALVLSLTLGLQLMSSISLNLAPPVPPLPEGPPKKVFDINSNRYVDPDELLTPLQRCTKEFHAQFVKLNHDPQYKQLNLHLNEYLTPLLERLFDDKHVTTLRYTYYHQFVCAYSHIYNEALRKVDGRPVLAYMRRIDDRHCKAPITGLPPLEATVADNLGPNFDTGHWNVGTAMRLTQFWNNVYQDIKFELTRSNLDYFELLPLMGATIGYFSEAIDYFLVAIDQLAASTEGLTLVDDVNAINELRFFHLRDHHYEYIGTLNDHFTNLFHQQYIMNHDMANLTPTSSHKEAFQRKQVLAVLINTIVTNIYQSIPHDADLHASPDGVLELWRSLLNFIVFDMFTADPVPATLRHHLVAHLVGLTVLTNPLVFSSRLVRTLEHGSPVSPPNPEFKTVIVPPLPQKRKRGLLSKFKLGR